MAKASELYGSKYLSADDIDEKPVQVDIVGAWVETFPDDNERERERIVIQFGGTKKPLIVNATNAEALIKGLGDDTDEWIGGVVTVFKTKVMYNGKNVPALRLRDAKRIPTANVPRK